MVRRSPSAALVLLASAALAALTTPTVAHASRIAAVLSPGSVTELSAPGIGLRTPVDGRIRGFGFSATVTGVGAGSVAGPVGATVASGRHHHLVVFSLTVNTFDSADGPGLNGAPDVTADVAIAATDYSFDTTDLFFSGQQTYAVSVPNGASSVELQMTSEGLTQSFSLITLRRVGVQPTVLYRDGSQPWVSQQVGKAVTVPAIVEADGFSALETLGVQTVELTNFQPGAPTTQPGDPTLCYLVLTATETSDPNPPPGGPEGSHFVGNFSALPGSALTLQVAGSPPVTATHIGSTTNDLLDGTYFFTVPADLTTATLTITPGTVPGAEFQEYTGVPTNVTFPQPATFALSLPAPAPVPTQVRSPPSKAPAGPRHRPSPVIASTSFLVILVPVIGGLIVLAAAPFLLVRRRTRPSHRAWTKAPRNAPPLRPNELPTLPRPLLALPAGPGADPREAVGPAPQDPDSATEAESPSTQVGENESDLVEVLILGPVEVRGWCRRPKRAVATPLLCYLALHSDRSVSADQLLGAMWPIDDARPEASRSSLHTYVSDLRGALGKGRLPQSEVGAGYRLSDSVLTDWAVFSERVAEADRFSPPSRHLLREALELVRGPPFADCTGPTFEWAHTEHFVSTIEVAVTEAAHRLSVTELEAGDAAAAIDAARRGLRAVPDSVVLLRDLLLAAEASGDPAEIRRAREAGRHAYGDEVESVLGIDDLGRDGHRSL